MTPDRREILERVASGEISPEEADQLLRSLDGTPSPEAPAPTGTKIRTVKVTAGFGAIVVSADPTVAEAEIEGRHSASIDGDVLVIRGEQWTDDEDAPGPGAFTIHLGGRNRRKRFHLGGLHIGGERTNLRIRMNPSLGLDARIDAGPMAINGILGPIRARSAAGPIALEGFEGPLDVSVNAGAVRASGRLTHGDSRIRSDAGAVRVELDPSSSVSIRAEAALGKVLVLGDDAPKRGRFGPGRQEATIGDGTGTLRVETAMGSIHVTTS
jgi:hypothetical protein